MAMQVAWSPLSTSQGTSARRFCVLAVGTKSGRVWLWRYRMPSSYSLADQDAVDANFALVSTLPRYSMSWGPCDSVHCDEVSAARDEPDHVAT